MVILKILAPGLIFGILRALNCYCCWCRAYIYITRAPVFVFVCLFYVTEICGKRFYIINEVKILC